MHKYSENSFYIFYICKNDIIIPIKKEETNNEKKTICFKNC